MSMEEAALYEAPFEYVVENVKPGPHQKQAQDIRRELVDSHGAASGDEGGVFRPSDRYIATPRVSKHRLFTHGFRNEPYRTALPSPLPATTTISSAFSTPAYTRCGQGRRGLSFEKLSRDFATLPPPRSRPSHFPIRLPSRIEAISAAAQTPRHASQRLAQSSRRLRQPDRTEASNPHEPLQRDPLLASVRP